MLYLRGGRSHTTSVPSLLTNMRGQLNPFRVLLILLFLLCMLVDSSSVRRQASATEMTSLSQADAAGPTEQLRRIKVVNNTAQFGINSLRGAEGEEEQVNRSHRRRRSPATDLEISAILDAHNTGRRQEGASNMNFVVSRHKELHPVTEAN